jgi:hypothetical protein
MSNDTTTKNDITDGLTPDELAAEGVTALPDKEVVSILDLQVDADIGLDLAAPIDLAVAANANVAAPIDAAVGANVLSAGSSAQALSDQGVMITQGVVGDASASATQVSDLDQTNDVADAGVPAPVPPTDGGVTGVDTGDMLSGDVLNVDVDLAADLNVAAPIAGAVAANANVAAPIDAAAAANIGSIASSATAIADQDAIIDQSIEGDATAISDQDSELSQ